MHTTALDTTAAVDEFMARLDDPHKAGVQALRQVILDVDPAIAEGVKWNAPSFRINEYFATVHLRTKAGVGVVLHRGAKAKKLAERLSIDDPDHLLTWLDADRAMVVFADAGDVGAKRRAFQRVLRDWIEHL